MENAVIIISLILLGLCFGSFVNALVWRIYKKRNFVSERSECTHCHHILAWYDLVPVFSWLWLRGKCRYCHRSIDDSPLTEIGVALAFGLSYYFWPFGLELLGIALLVTWLVAVVLLAALFVYDLKWMLLPNVLNFPLLAVGVVWAVLYQIGYLHNDVATGLIESGLGILSVAGLYGALYAVSKGAWVGFGDVKLGIFMGLTLGWKLGLLAVVLANVIALVAVLPGMLSGSLKRTSRIPFGPFLILATVLALLFGDQIIHWYSIVIFTVSL